MARAGDQRIDELHPRGAAGTVRDRLDATDLRSFARSSPAKLIAMGVLLVGICVFAGVVAATAVNSRQHALDHLLSNTEPEANSAARLYTSLSVSDAAAGTAFISGGLQAPPVRDRYEQAVGGAATELVAQSAAPADDPDANLRTGIATRLPIYTGLVETAHAEDRNGHPVGAAYLSEASNLMQTTMLPMAQELQQRRSDAIVAIQHRHVRPPWSAIVLPLLALAALVAAQWYLARTWRRLLNPGLVLASAALIVLLVWVVIAGSLSAVTTTAGRDNGTVPAATLTTGRILVQQARAAETLKLVRRDASGDYDRTFDDSTARVARLLDDFPRHTTGFEDVPTARTALNRWHEAHNRMNDALARGDFQAAAAIAIGADPADATAEVDVLDRALGSGIVAARTTLRTRISDAAAFLNLLAPGALMLSMLAAICVMLGLWPRLREYR